MHLYDDSSDIFKYKCSAPHIVQFWGERSCHTCTSCEWWFLKVYNEMIQYIFHSLKMQCVCVYIHTYLYIYTLPYLHISVKKRHCPIDRILSLLRDYTHLTSWRNEE